MYRKGRAPIESISESCQPVRTETRRGRVRGTTKGTHGTWWGTLLAQKWHWHTPQKPRRCSNP